MNLIEKLNDSLEGPKLLTYIVYGLNALAFLSGIPLIIGVIINYASKDDFKNTWIESHLRWQIRTFWIALAAVAIGIMTSNLIVIDEVGYLVILITYFWVAYRVIRGVLNLIHEKEMYVNNKSLTTKDILQPKLSRETVLISYGILGLSIFLFFSGSEFLFISSLVVILFWARKIENDDTFLTDNLILVKKIAKTALIVKLILLILSVFNFFSIMASVLELSSNRDAIFSGLSAIAHLSIAAKIDYILFVWMVFKSTLGILRFNDQIDSAQK